MLTERRRPEPIFVAAWVGVDYWLRIEVPTEVLVRSRRRREREIGRIVRAHYAEHKGSAGPSGKITGYVFRSLPDRAIRYSGEGVAQGEHRGPEQHSVARMRQR